MEKIASDMAEDSAAALDDAVSRVEPALVTGHTSLPQYFLQLPGVLRFPPAFQITQRRCEPQKSPSGADVTVEPFGEGEALVVRDGTGYITRVYCYDGYLMELFTAADTLLLPESGKKILEMGELSLSLTTYPRPHWPAVPHSFHPA